MKDADRTKKQLIDVLALLREQLSKPDGSTAAGNRAEDALQTLVSTMGRSVGREFFDHVVKDLYDWLASDCVILGELIDDDTVRTIAMKLDGETVEGFVYPLDGTPCEDVLEKGFCFFAEGVSGLFPNDKPLVEMAGEGYVGTPLKNRDGHTIGILCAITRTRLVLPPKTSEVMEILADRVSAEIERAQAEQDLRESEAKYRMIHNTAFDAIIIADSTNKIVDYNASAEKIFGYDKGGLAGKKLIDIMPEEYRERHIAGFKRYVETGESKIHGQVIELKGLHKDGTEFPIELTVNSFGLHNNIYFTGTIRDITDKKRYEDEQLRMQRLESLGVLAGGIAHDFNNLLARLMGDISFLDGQVAPGGEGHTRMQEAEQTILEARDLSRQLLTFAKGGSPVKKPIKTYDLLTSAVGFALRGSNLKSEFDIDPDLPSVVVDPGQINQVITNLVINAVHAMPGGGTINVSAANAFVGSEDPMLEEGKYVKVTVADHGTGIEKKVLGKIFDPFFTTKEDGRGLGLSTAYSIIKKHGGRILTESEPGAGASFTFYLPTSDKKAAVKEKKEKPVAGDARILMMDDEKEIRELSCLLLARLGYKAEGVSDGVEAIARYKAAKDAQEPFDIIILDLTVPGGMGGKEVVRELLKIDPEVKAIVASGYSDDPVLAEFKKFGFSGMVGKPYSVADLSRAINNVIQDKDSPEPSIP